MYNKFISFAVMIAKARWICCIKYFHRREDPDALIGCKCLSCILRHHMFLMRSK